MAPIRASISCNETIGQGWVSQPNQRGTLDILWTCISTLFICLWVQLHLNLPASHEGLLRQSWRRFRWLLLGALVPEAFLLSAGGQWASAKRSQAAMKALGLENWSLAHGFYADSGGFLIHSQDAPAFPANAKQIHYLVKNKYIPMPEITQKEIFDKSKGDKFTKTVACFQTLWFMTQCTGRIIQGLPVSPLEYQTCAIIICTLTTYYYWLHKPLDVQTPTIIRMKTPMAAILIAAGPIAKEPYRYTPLDFVEAQAHIMSLFPRFCRDNGPYRKPFRRIPNDRNPQLLDIRQRAFLGINVILFSTLSFAEWYFAFPSAIEKTMWRCACVTAESCLFIHALADAVGNRQRRKKGGEYQYIEGYKLRMPVGLIFFWIPFFTYLGARLVIIGLAVSSLRRLPIECYTTVPWASMLPHIS
ncbi:hypothetical protein ONS95_000518 [Cadophora gregata]|uniref:uncharacterized protein n=1 Tax=Cadophora gregata TaxID=51156 RepID=UPI0026DBC8FC|nr:uncharacterized protein ONS95_000518 [Cadophora gregata]KAK0125473.1 hypothetical protein ONS96_009311 [Cadophora gregata f. sp. sojae]KAK0128553.1 hypothetical protein ONS95_000518 [Cadophora gregata]